MTAGSGVMYPIPGEPIPPQYRLFDATLRLAQELVIVRTGVATAGTATSLTDTNVPVAVEPFTNGTIWLTDENVCRVIATNTGNVFTFITAVPAPASGSRYAVADSDIPRSVLVSSINHALQSFNLIAEDATLVVVADQEEYTLPVGISRIYKVEIANSLTTPYHYVKHYHWDEKEGKLRFPVNFLPVLVGAKIRLMYRKVYQDLLFDEDSGVFIPENDEDLIPAIVDRELLHWMAVQNAAKYGLHIHGNDPKRGWADKISEAEVRIQRLSSRQINPQRTPRLADY